MSPTAISFLIIPWDLMQLCHHTATEFDIDFIKTFGRAAGTKETCC